MIHNGSLEATVATFQRKRMVSATARRWLSSWTIVAFARDTGADVLRQSLANLNSLVGTLYASSRGRQSVFHRRSPLRAEFARPVQAS